MISIKSAVLGLGLSVAMAGVSSAGTELRYSEAGPNRGARAKALQYFLDEASRRTDGELTFDVHWGGALLKWSAALNGIAAGAADMGTVIAPYAPKQLQGLAIGDLPISSSDTWVGLRAMHELLTTNAQLKDFLAKENVVFLSNFTSTGTQFECTGDHKIEKVEDFDGLTVRATGTVGKALNEIGANVVNMTFDKVYQALDSGLVDCAAGYYYTNRAFRHYEIINHITEANWGQVGGFALIMNKHVWEDLPPEHQEAVMAAGSNMVDEFARIQLATINDVKAGLASGEIGRKVPVVPLAEEERVKLLALSDKYVQKWIDDMTGRGYDGQGIWDEYAGLVDKYAAELDAKGYPWDR
ncbi:C4-dicarboxylate TRAP transporter substrate-binding protein [Labrenzia sp. PHM005]|uniref:C4-dicarboxylate TRAP transporter substrate-binding protein n=1 Tax=Labrenzia sp. PHM005 TaxID=2590016 RepID=UPI001140690C|nr:C4-dicarboxylate TRAP transporter substrate-binding protein [Labrenzia sp. PHM005]QDG75000.1 ABC transporter substrate-binding protein [Labrenzia sp. PHM005]